MKIERLTLKRDYYKKMHLYAEINLWFMVFLLIGGVMNFLVISKNRGRMPVLNYNVNNEEHFGYNEYEKEEIYYESLGDKIDIFGKARVSIGDIFMIIGGVGIFYVSTKKFILRRDISRLERKRRRVLLR